MDRMEPVWQKFGLDTAPWLSYVGAFSTKVPPLSHQTADGVGVGVCRPLKKTTRKKSDYTDCHNNVPLRESFGAKGA